MKRTQDLPFVACLAMILAAAGSAVATAAEDVAPAQDLVNVQASDRVLVSRWTKQPDSYVLLVAFDESPRKNSETANTMAAVKVETAPAKPAPQPAAPYAPAAGGAMERGDRGSFFIGNTVANLRGTDPTFTCRKLTLVDGRRVASPVQSPQPPPQQLPSPQRERPSALNQPYRSALKDPRIGVWLLKADGTLILPTTYSCDGRPTYPETSATVELSYIFAAADGAEAVAVAIRIFDDYYIERLQPLEPKPATR